MPIRLLRYSELDLAAWDACVNSAREVVPYATSWWLQATAGRWDALVLQEELKGRYLAVWPLPVKRRPWGRELHQPPFTQQLGILTAAEGAAEPGCWPLDVLPAHYTRAHLQLNDENAQPTSVPSAIRVQRRITYHLPLHQAYETIRAGYCADYRRRLRLHEAVQAPLAVTETQDAEPLLALFRQTQGPAAGLKNRQYMVLRCLVQALSARRLLAVRVVRHPTTQELLAGSLFVHYRSRLIYLFAAASAQGKKAGAPLLLVDAAVRAHAGTPGLILDFEGGMIPSIARFFANFGAAPVPYAALSFTQRPWYLKWMR